MSRATVVFAVALALLVTATALAKPPVFLPLKPNVLVAELDKAVAAGDRARAEQVIRVLVVLGKRARPALTAALAVEGSRTRPALLEAVSRMAPEMRLLAKPLLRHKSPETRALAALALDGADKNILLVALAREKNEIVQFSLIDSLASCDDPDVTEVLCDTLANSPNPKLRSRSLRGLKLRRDKRALPDVHAALRDRDARVRMAGIQTVASIGDRHSVRVLLDLVRIETAAGNTRAIWQALEEMTGQDKLARDPDAWLRWLESDS